MTVKFIDIAQQYENERGFLQPRIDEVLRSGMHVGGDEVDAFEQEIAAYVGAGYAVGVGSGTDALILAMRALEIGPGDEVITPPNSFATSTSSIVAVGATPVFADVGQDELIDPDAIAAVISPATRAIMPVHLRGGVCELDEINAIAERHNLLVIEDAAQAIGSAWKDVRTGILGDVGCFSAHPLKVLNAVGDAGFVTTNNKDLADRIKVLRNAGLKDRDTVAEWSGVSRLDPIQAAVLRERLERLPDVIARRRAIADKYLEAFRSIPDIVLPFEKPGETRVYNTFTIQYEHRDALQNHLAGRGVQSLVHYPKTLNRQPASDLTNSNSQMPVAERLSKTILSLPVHQMLTDTEVGEVIDGVTSFFQ